MNILSILKLWKMQKQTLKGRIIISKTFALSKVIYLAILIIFARYINKEIERIQEHFI